MINMKYTLQKFNIQMNVSKIANIQYFEFTSDYHTQNDSHDFCELLYVDKGTIMVSAESFKGSLSVNQMIIHKANEIHSLSTPDTSAPNVIIIGFRCVSPELEGFSKAPVTLSSELSRALAKILQEAIIIYEPPYDVPNTTYMKKRNEYPFGTDQMIKISLEEFLILLVREYQNNNIKAEESQHSAVNTDPVYRYITENYNTKITLSNLCFLFGTNKTTLCRAFKEKYDDTIMNYINKFRIREAKTLLREGKKSITEISEKVGFDSVHYFSRVFEKHTGQPPSSYVKSVRSKLNINK